MATVKVVDLISRAHTLLLDASAVRWPALELQNYLNDGYRELVTVRPDANAQTATFTCAASYKQNISNLFPRAYRLMDVRSNVAATSHKRAVRLVSRSALDATRPSWYNEPASIDIEKFIFDPRNPKEFLVYPPATNTAQLEILYAEVPEPHALTSTQLMNPATTEVIRVDDIYANPLLDYMMYRAYSKDSEQQGNAQRAVAYYQAMMSGLGVKAQSDAAAQPGAS